MRAPRFRFPNEVRETTRTIASRMVRENSVARTPEELEAWISERPGVKESLEQGGYGTEFTAADLFPLLQVFIVQAGGPAPPVEAPPRSSSRVWVVGLGLLVVLLLLVMAIGLLR